MLRRFQVAPSSSSTTHASATWFCSVSSTSCSSSLRFLASPAPPGATPGAYRPVKSEDTLRAMQKLPKLNQTLRTLPVNWKTAQRTFQREQFLDPTRSPVKTAEHTINSPNHKRFHGSMTNSDRAERSRLIDQNEYLQSLGLRPKIRTGSSDDPSNYVGDAPTMPLPSHPVARLVGDQRLRIALVGATNAGKSAIWNKLCATYEQSRGLPRNRVPQIVMDSPGLTRDATEAIGMLKDENSADGEIIFTVVDTPGCIDGEILFETAKAIDSCHAVLFVVGADNDLRREDHMLAKYLNGLRKVPVICVLAKSDLTRHRLEEFRQELSSALDLGLPVPVSTYTETGFGDLATAVAPLSDIQQRVRTWRDWSVEDAALSGDEAALEEVRMRNTRERPIRVAFIGRTRSGKSSLVNCLLGEYKSRSRPDEAMTTRDTVETECAYGGRRFQLIDTAPAVRGRVRKSREFLNQLHNSMLRAINFADVCVICFDARDGMPNKYDMALAYHCTEEGRPFLFAATHWDAVVDAAATAEAIDFKIKRQLSEVRYAHAVVTSCVPTVPSADGGELLQGREAAKSKNEAVVGLNLALLMKEVVALHDGWNKFIPSSDLTRFWRKIEKSTNIPMKNTRIHRIKQTHARPPTFVLRLQSKDLDAYVRGPLMSLIRNAICEEFGFRGVPVRIIQENKIKYPDVTI